MKIGIVTFHNAHNYGAVLQAWSLQEYLRQQGHEAQIVNLRLPSIDKLYQLTYKTTSNLLGHGWLNRFAGDVYYWLRCTSYRFTDPARSRKFRAFEHFINHKLPVTKEEYPSYVELQQAKLHYNALIAGSDQIWNVKMMKGMDLAYFLQFANRDALRISYAASIGSEEIPPEYRLLFQRYLREFDSISVREKKAQEQIRQLTDQPVDLVADPTFLLDRGTFEKLKKNPRTSGKYIYVHNVHLKRVDNSLNSVAEEMSKRLNLPIIHNWDRKVFSREAGHFTGGIEEFLGYVANAEYVVTNSFHCTVFALIFNRNFITVPHYTNPDRMKNLLEELGLSNHLLSHGSMIPEDLSELSIDYPAVEARKEAMGDHARAFLDRALKERKERDDRTYFDYEDVFRCYGCGACKAACPVQAITMEVDREGFRYPVIHPDLCIHCDRCKKVCIYHQKSSKNPKQEGDPVVYAARSNDARVVKESTSGGMFTPMYQSVLARGGAVAGVRYGEDLQVIYDIAETEQDCQKFRGTKYVFAESGDVKERVRKLLQDGRTVLFTGTPCQIAAVKSYLGKPYENLYTVELICHGASSPKAFRKYCDYLEEVYQSKISRFQFRNQFKGPGEQFILVEFESGSIDLENALKNNFNRAFRSNNLQRPSCFQCEFVGRRTGVADLTIGDYWEVEKEHPDFPVGGGVSILKINTPHGQEFFETFRDQLDLEESTFKKAYAHNYAKVMNMRDSRAKLMYYLDEKPIDDLLLTFNHLKKGGIKNL